eukprot:jgi/Botrbrau1/21063/Bobra.0144s0062.1
MELRELTGKRCTCSGRIAPSLTAPFRSVKHERFPSQDLGMRRKRGAALSRRPEIVLKATALEDVKASPAQAAPAGPEEGGGAPTDIEYDAVIIGAGMGGLTTASQMASKGAKVVVLEKYLIPGGSAGHYNREGYTFDVGSSMMFGFGKEGNTNLITRALEAVGKSLPTVPDPTQIHYHLPKSAAHPQELSEKFPAEREGLRRFYDDCWVVFNALNSLDLKSLEEPRYLLGGAPPPFTHLTSHMRAPSLFTHQLGCAGAYAEFVKQPVACLTLASYLTTNSGDVARRYIKDPELLRFIDIECYCWSTRLGIYESLQAWDTIDQRDDAKSCRNKGFVQHCAGRVHTMINAGMVFCDRHYGGINYPIGGVGRIPEALVEGIQERGSYVEYKANAIVSNATRWDTFGKLIPDERLPKAERLFRQRYKKSPSFLTIHLGIRADALPPALRFTKLSTSQAKAPYSHAPVYKSGQAQAALSLRPCRPYQQGLVKRCLTPCRPYQQGLVKQMQCLTPCRPHQQALGLEPSQYEAKKREVAASVIARLEAIFPGLSDAIVFQEVGTPRTHRRFLNRSDGSYGPIPSRRPLGMLGMPMNRTAIPGLYCVGDSTFPGQGVNAVVFSGFGCAHRVLCDLNRQPTIPVLDQGYNALLSTARDLS